jgi:serpin B
VCAGEPLYIDLVVQRVRIAVDENGTEASAATAIAMRAGSKAPQGEPVPFHFDRPFAFALRHRETRCVLFTGVVRDPSLTQ